MLTALFTASQSCRQMHDIQLPVFRPGFRNSEVKFQNKNSIKTRPDPNAEKGARTV